MAGGLLSSLMSWIKVIGSTSAETPGTTPPVPGNYRVIRTDNLGRVEVVSPAGAPVSSLIYGYGGDGATLNAFPQYNFAPQDGAGFRTPITNVSATLGPLVLGKYHQIIVTTLCWVRVGALGVPAPVVGTSFPLAPGTYLYLPQANLNYIAVIRDNADGIMAIGQAEL